MGVAVPMLPRSDSVKLQLVLFSDRYCLKSRAIGSKYALPPLS